MSQRFYCSEQIIAVYRGWHALERVLGGRDVIDFDLTTVDSSVNFSSRSDVLAELRRLHHELSRRDDPEGEFLRSRLLGSIHYLRATMGEQIPFDTYLVRTLGITPIPFSEREIVEVRARVNAALAPFGLSLSKENVGAYRDRLMIHDAERIKDGIIDDQGFWLNRLRECGVPVPSRLNIDVEFAAADEYWSNWITGTPDGSIRLLINIHSRKEYDIGRPLALCLHEICGHAVQMSIWRERIRQGLLDPACGVTTVHAPEALLSEGLGQTVADLLALSGPLPDALEVSRALQLYTLIILHNAHLMLYDHVSIDQAIEFATSNLPFTSFAMIEAEMRDRGADPLFKTYQLSYAAGETRIRAMLRGMGAEEQRALFVSMYTHPMTPVQLAHCADVPRRRVDDAESGMRARSRLRNRP